MTYERQKELLAQAKFSDMHDNAELGTQYYDFIEKCWYDSRREKLAY